MKPSKLRLFWRLGFTHLLLLLVVVIALDGYAVQALRQDYLRAAFSQLESLALLARGRPPAADNRAELESWVSWMTHTGTRVTVVAADGRVLADSDEDPSRMENHANRPEIRDALRTGNGRAVRYSSTVGRDLVYLAVQYEQAKGLPVVIRLSVPVARLEEALAAFRLRLWTISFVILVVAEGVSVLFFRMLSTRVQRLNQFSRRVADGDFHPLPIDRHSDELADLSATLSETAARLNDTIRTLTDERNQSAAILRSMVEGVAVIGSDQRVLFCNAAFRRALSIDGQWTGRPAVEVIRDADLIEVVRQALAGNESIGSEMIIGSVRTKSFHVTGAPVRSHSSTVGAVLVLHDVSELRRLERARRDFVANVSHEFRTPLTAIRGFAETLLGGALEDEENGRRFLEIIRNHSIRLERLTEDLLKLAQIEAGKLDLEFRIVDVSQIIDPCVETSRAKAAARQLKLEIDCPFDLPPVYGDVDELRRVVQNLLDNAVRYTEPGGNIALRARSEESRVLISVSDTGIGIPKTEQERIFERFYRVDATRSREMGGTGLGLSIVKHLVEAHHGRIQLQSEVGRGSTFTIVLPQA